MDLKESFLEKQIIRTALLGPAFIVIALAVASVQAQFAWQLLLWAAILGLAASWMWKLKGWYMALAALGMSLWFSPPLTSFALTFSVTAAIACWITAIGYLQIEIWFKELLAEGGKQYTSAVSQLEEQVAVLEQLDVQKSLHVQQLKDRLEDSLEKHSLCEQELNQNQAKVHDLISAFESKEKNLQQQICELQKKYADSIAESQQWQKKAEHNESLQSSLEKAICDIEQLQQKEKHSDELEIKYARAMSDIEQWQLRVQQLMDATTLQSVVEAEVNSNIPPALQDSECAEISSAKTDQRKSKAKTTKGKGSKSKKTNNWANTIMSRWSDS